MPITGTIKLAFLVTAIAALLGIATLTVAIRPSAGPAHAQDATPDAPTGLRITSSTHDSVTLTWDDPDDSSITGYQVLRRYRDGDEYGDGHGTAEFVSVVDDTGSPATTYTDTSVTARTRYVYRVKAINSAGTSGQSRYANAETPSGPPPPSAPTGLTAPMVTHDRVTLSWDDPDDSSITGYQVLRRYRDGDEYGDGHGAAEFVSVVDDTGSPATTYTDTSVTERTRYVYRVKAINSIGISGLSGYLNVDTPVVPPPPSAPTGLIAASVVHDRVTLTWDDPGDDSITGYQVLRRYRDGDQYGDNLGAAEFVAVSDDIGTPATAYTDDSVTPGTRYVYRVRARNPQGLSGNSSNATAETPTVPSLSPARGSRPNVVIILADDLGWGDVQSNNPDSAMTTPHIDSIAAAGVKFTDAHSPSAMCSPTRYGLLTGRYAWRSWLTKGVLGGRSRPLIGPSRPTLGTLLQGHGYRTAAIGKWHLGMDFAHLSDIDEVNSINRGIDFDAAIQDGPLDHGFDEFFGTSANLNWQPHVYIRDRHFAADPERLAQHTSGSYRTDEVLDRLTEAAVAFIEREGQTEDPFFLYLPVHAPHVPVDPNPRFLGLTGLGGYGDVVAQLDWSVGQVLDTLERVGASEDTLVVFSSDNGSGARGIPIPNHVGAEHMTNGMWRGGKGTIHEGGHRVPLLVRWPRALESGATVANTVSLTDLYATLADILEEEPAPGVAPDSVSLLPLLLGEAETRGVPVVHHSRNGMFALRDGHRKLVFGNGDGGAHGTRMGEPFGQPWRLFDLEQDHKETNNVADSHPEVVERMEAALERIRAAEDGTLSTDPTLRSLNLAGIDIGPFDHGVRSYSAIVGREMQTVAVKAIPTATDALLTISDADGSGDMGQRQVRLTESTTTINVTVTAPDRSATTKYVVTLTRAEETPKGPTIAGTAEVGETLTADTSSITDADGLTGATFSYQWVSYDGRTHTDIASATEATYTLVPADEGKAFRVRVSFTDDADNKQSLTSALARSERPYGLAASGSESAVALTWKLPAGWANPSTFQMLRNRPELGETEPLVRVRYLQAAANTYTDSDVEPGVLYVYRVKGVDPFGYTGEASQSVQIRTAGTAPADNRPATGAPVISGAAQVGMTLTADTSGIADPDGLADAAFSYQWLADDVDIASATSSSYTLVDAGEGHAVKVRVSFTDDAGHSESLTSAATATVQPKPNRPATGQPTITGNPAIGNTLGVDLSAVSDPNGLTDAAYSYQWLRSDTAIGGGTGSTYSVLRADAGHNIKVVAAFTDDNGFDESVTSEAVSIPLPPLTAGLVRTGNTPANHDGSSTFTIRLNFSEHFSISYTTVRDHALEVANGEVINAARVDRDGDERNRRWTITIEPSNDNDVEIAIAATTDCEDDGAICTPDGRMLSSELTLTVEGPS